MDIRSALREDPSKIMVEKVVRHLLDHPGQFGELMAIVEGTDVHLRLRAASVAAKCFEEMPMLASDRMGQLIDWTGSHTPDALRRLAWRSFQFIPLPEEKLGFLFDRGINTLVDRSTPVAILAQVMSVVDRIAASHPDLRPELHAVLLTGWENAPPAYVSRARKILNGRWKSRPL